MLEYTNNQCTTMWTHKEANPLCTLDNVESGHHFHCKVAQIAVFNRILRFSVDDNAPFVDMKSFPSVIFTISSVSESIMPSAL